MRQRRNIAASFMECSACILGIDQNIEYKIAELLKLIGKKYYKIVNISDIKSKKHNIRVFKNMRKNMKQRYGKRELLGYPPFEYQHILDKILSGKKLKAGESTLKMLFPELPAGVYFIEKLLKTK